MRIPTFALVLAAAIGLGALLWNQLEAESPGRVRQAAPRMPLTESESTGSAPTLPAVAALPPIATPPVERGTGGPDEVMAANDQNGDGLVTKEEARVANKSLFQMWDAYDTNKDGSVDAAEIDEVNDKYFTIAKMQARRTGPEAIIKANDRNGDGVVTREEAQQVNKALIANWSMYDLNIDGRTDSNEIAKALTD